MRERKKDEKKDRMRDREESKKKENGRGNSKKRGKEKEEGQTQKKKLTLYFQTFPPDFTTTPEQSRPAFFF